MSRKKKTRAELAAENKVLKWHGFGTNVTKIIHDLIKYGVLAFLIYTAGDAVHSLAGKKTDADIKLKADASLSLSGNDGKTDEGFSPYFLPGLFGLIFGILGIVYGRKQERLRKDVIEKFQGYKKDQELLIDPRRSSSRITKRGETRPDDL